MKEKEKTEQEKTEKKAASHETDLKPGPSEKNEHGRDIAELTDTLKRVQADYENYRKRVDKQQEELAKFAALQAMSALLPIIDDLELALKNAHNKDDGFYKGIELIYAKLTGMLTSEGIEPLDALGKRFDPALHEALLTEESDKEPGTVIEELQKGYVAGDRVVRTAKVKVAT